MSYYIKKPSHYREGFKNYNLNIKQNAEVHKSSSCDNK